MHSLELILYLITLSSIYLIFSKRDIKKYYFISILSVYALLVLIQLILNPIRWQLFSLYGAIGIVFILFGFRIFTITVFRPYQRRLSILVVMILLIVSGFSLFAFPIYDIPTPSGTYLIGTESYIIEDESRIELYSDEDNEFRKIKIQIWYPAETVEGYKRAPWLEDGVVVARALSVDTGLPFFVLDHAADIMSNSYIGAPISTEYDEYPIVIISHGWRGFKNLHTDFAEELASLGFIVVSIDHSYGSVATVFSEDDISYLNLDALPDRETNDDFLQYANQLVNTYADDVSTTLDYLETLNDDSTSIFNGTLDLTSIGLLGHSTGGGGDVVVALNDDRIDSVIGLDAWVEPILDSEISKGLNIPSLFIRSGAWEIGFNNENLYSLVNQSSYTSEVYQIDGTTHYDFAMVYMYSPLTKYIGFTGDVESEYLTDILKSMITDFFEETLKDNPNSSIDPGVWEEVIEVVTE